MEKGARHRTNAEKSHPAGSESKTGSGEGGVSLKKEIGLVSACGIIVGECIPAPTTRLPPRPGGPPAET